MQNYETLSTEVKETLNSDKFIEWLTQDLTNTILAEITTQLDKKLHGKNPTKMPRKFYEVQLKRLRNSFLSRVLPVPALSLPLFEALPKEKMKAIEQQEIASPLTKEVIAELITSAKDITIDPTQQALLYLTNNHFDEAYALYQQHYNEPKPVVREKTTPVAPVSDTKKIKKQLETERKHWQRKMNALEQDKLREQKKYAAKVSSLQQQCEEGRAQITQLLAEVQTTEEMRLQHIARIQALEVALHEKEHALKEAEETVTTIAAREPEAVMLGFIEHYDPYDMERTIFTNTSGELQFGIRPLSSPYKRFPLQDITKITSWGTDLVPTGFRDVGGTNDERCAHLYRHTQHDLLLFKCYKRPTTTGQAHWVARDIELLPRTEQFTLNDFYQALPVFTPKSSETADITAFLKRLQSRKFVGRIEQISHDVEDTPTIIFYETADSLFFIGSFTSHHYAHGGFKFDVTEDSPLRYGEVPADIRSNLYRYRDVAFIEQAQLDALRYYMQDAKTLRVEAPTEQVIVVKSFTQTIANEAAFFARWLKQIEAMQLAYEPLDLHNFHTCMKTGGLTILAGMSGTGKSQLIQSYQRSLGLTAEQFLFIPVSPTWTDDADILGYFDAEKAQYEPAATGIVDVLLRAEKYPKETHIICFDEMNLARLEHYFSQFLSLVELAPEDRKLKLYNPRYANKAAHYPAEIKIGDNVVFVGTINLDESTHQLSDKALDRANLLTLRVLPFAKAFQQKAPVALGTLKKPLALHDFVDATVAMSLSDRQLSFLWALHELLQQISEYSGVGPRIVRQIDKYMKNISDFAGGALTAKVAFDLQIVQRIISKIRGNATVITDIVEGDGAIAKLCDDYEDVSAFTYVREALALKAKELMQHGYAF